MYVVGVVKGEKAPGCGVPLPICPFPFITFMYMLVPFFGLIKSDALISLYKLVAISIL